MGFPFNYAVIINTANDYITTIESRDCAIPARNIQGINNNPEVTENPLALQKYNI